MKILTKSFDGKIVSVEEELLEEYNNTQRKISMLLSQGKTLDEVLQIVGENDEK